MQATGSFSAPVFATGVARSAVALAGVGFLAVGISGAFLLGVGTLFGQSVVAADVTGITYTAERCADFLRLEPDAQDCMAAAEAHHFDEAVDYRAALGVLGLIILGVIYAAGRWANMRIVSSWMPNGFTHTVAASAFGVLATILLLLAAAHLAFQGVSGSGPLLSDGLVALVFCLGYGVALYRSLRRRSTT